MTVLITTAIFTGDVDFVARWLRRRGHRVSLCAARLPGEAQAAAFPRRRLRVISERTEGFPDVGADLYILVIPSREQDLPCLDPSLGASSQLIAYAQNGAATQLARRLATAIPNARLALTPLDLRRECIRVERRRGDRTPSHTVA